MVKSHNTTEYLPDQLLLIYATKDNFEEDMKECQDMLNV